MVYRVSKACGADGTGWAGQTRWARQTRWAGEAGRAGEPGWVGQPGRAGRTDRAGEAVHAESVERKTAWRRVVLTTVCLLGICVPDAAHARAQGAEPAQGAGTTAGPGQTGRSGRGAAMHGSHAMLGGLMLDQLNLTDAQRDQVKNIVDSHRTDLQALGERLGTARRSLESAVSADVTDEAAIRARAGDVAAVDADMAVMRARIRSQVLQILTSEQQTTLKNLEARRHDRGRNKR